MVPSLNASVDVYQHEKTNATIVHVPCADTENCFCIAIPTPAPDETGMPHILEHMTLAGSRKFPCKEPFFEMIKRSMATFINALTGAEMTYYPVCSTVRDDLFNLADVYFDAVFHPLLSQDTFDREAHHLAPADPANALGGLRIDGVVYSEMKGVFSDPESVLERQMAHYIVPDTPYARESGGDPDFIPDLTLEKLRKFHATRYNPSNAIIVLYGDIPAEKWFEFLEPRLGEFGAMPKLERPSRQPRWSAPVRRYERYPSAPNEDDASKTYLSMSWLAGDATDVADGACLAIVSTLLFGNDAAPLKKAITDSHIGANVCSAGAFPLGSDLVFGFALDGSEADRMDALRDLVMGVLKEASEKQFDPIEVEAAFQQGLYACLEVGREFPLGVSTKVATAWNAGVDPASMLDAKSLLDDLKARIDGDPMFVSRFIKERLLDNQHRLELVLSPDKGLEAENQKKLQARLDAVRKAKSDAEMLEIAARARHLDEVNAKPNSDDDLACLPRLDVRDVPTSVRRPERTVEQLSETSRFAYNSSIPSNGIVYASAAFPLVGLPEELLPYAYIFSAMFSDFGTNGVGYLEATRLRSLATGSFSATLKDGFDLRTGTRYIPRMCFSLKTTPENLNKAFGLMHDAVFGFDPSDAARAADLLLQYRTFERSNIVQDARRTASVHACRTLDAIGAREHLTTGLPYIALLDELAAAPDGVEKLAAALASIRDFITRQGGVDFSMVGPSECVAPSIANAKRWLAELPGARASATSIPAAAFNADLSPRAEGLYGALQVSFSALAMPAPHVSSPDSPLVHIGASLISSNWLLPEIRFKGNAYGAGLRYSATSSRFVFSSYRDPHVAETLDVFRRSLDWARNAKWTQSEIDDAIITFAGSSERPFRPGETAAKLLADLVFDKRQEDLDRRRTALLAATPEKVRDATVAALEAAMPHASYCVAASREMLEKSRGAIDNLAISPILGGDSN